MANYDYYNRNPLGLLEEDCVTRAISLASGLNYYDIRHKLELTAELFDCPALCVCCYENLLDCVFQFPRIECRGMTVREFAEQHPIGIYLVRMEGHLSTIVEGRCKDIFDCTDYVVTDAWCCGEINEGEYYG